jgi:cysteine desulfurase
VKSFLLQGGTEADNAIIRCAVETYGIKHAISTPIEHHAVTHTLETLEKQKAIELHFVKLRFAGQCRFTTSGRIIENLSQCVGVVDACQ